MDAHLDYDDLVPKINQSDESLVVELEPKEEEEKDKKKKKPLTLNIGEQVEP